MNDLNHHAAEHNHTAGRPLCNWLLMFAILVTLGTVGCGGGASNSPSITGTTPMGSGPNTGSTNPGNTGGTGGASLVAPKFVYALNGTAIMNPGVAAFRMDPSSGVLTMISSTTLMSNRSISGLAATPATNFVFVGDPMANTITIFRADPNSGMLTMLNTMSVPELQTEAEMLTSPDGKFLFVSTSTLQSARILVFNIGTLGSLTPVAGSPFLVSTQLGSMSTDAAGKFLFATQNNQVFGFVVGNDGSLTLTADSPFTVRAPFNNPDKGPVSVNAVLDPAAQFLFVGDSVNAVIHVYTVGLKGTLVEVSGSPFQSGIAGTAIATDPQGRFVFMGGGSAQLTALVVNRDTGVLTLAPGSPFDNGPFRSGGIPVFDAKVDPSGKFVLFADTEETKITVSAIDQTTGSLTNVAGSPFLTALRPIGGGSPSVITITH